MRVELEVKYNNMQRYQLIIYDEMRFEKFKV